MIINEYEINKNITKQDLTEVGFTNLNPKYMYYYKDLYNDITLNILIPVNKEELYPEDTKMRILDESFLQPFIPFYNLLNNPIKNTYPVLEEVVKNYNKEMNLLVEKGIFIQVTKEEQKPKTKVKKQ